LSALEDAVGPCDLLLDTADFLAVRAAAAMCGGKLLLELHAAGLLLALRQAFPRAGDKARATEREQAKARPADRPYK
jgi:hypothetical protein